MIIIIKRHSLLFVAKITYISFLNRKSLAETLCSARLPSQTKVCSCLVGMLPSSVAVNILMLLNVMTYMDTNLLMVNITCGHHIVTVSSEANARYFVKHLQLMVMSPHFLLPHEDKLVHYIRSRCCCNCNQTHRCKCNTPTGCCNNPPLVKLPDNTHMTPAFKVLMSYGSQSHHTE